MRKRSPKLGGKSLAIQFTPMLRNRRSAFIVCEAAKKTGKDDKSNVEIQIENVKDGLDKLQADSSDLLEASSNAVQASVDEAKANLDALVPDDVKASADKLQADLKDSAAQTKADLDDAIAKTKADMDDAAATAKSNLEAAIPEDVKASASKLQADLDEAVTKAKTRFEDDVEVLKQDVGKVQEDLGELASEVVDAVSKTVGFKTEPSAEELAGAAARAKFLEETITDREELKTLLVDSLFGLERGLNARGEVRAEISEIIAQLEAGNPNDNPTESLDILDGEWKLVYTANSELLPLLVANRLPGLTIGDIFQNINTTSMTVSNKVEFQSPIAKNSYSVDADFEIRSGKRIQVKFTRGTVGKPSPVGLEIPSTVSVLGQTLDTSILKNLAAPLESIASQIVTAAAGITPVSLPFGSNVAQGWLLTTYLDAGLRISRGDLGSIFVLVKAGGPLDQEK